MKAARRTLSAKLVDGALGRLLHLPAGSGYSVRRGVPVPMRDGVNLLADHYVPDQPARGTILVRSPYGRAGLFALLYARPYAERGYHVVVQSCRATFGSEGEVNAFAGEVEDGADTVAWLREEPWFTGTFATLGVSYLGFNQWALLVDPPPELAAAIIVSGPHDASRLLYGTGAFALQSAAGWGYAMVHQEDHGPVTGLVVMGLRADKQVAPALNDVPLGEGGRRVFGGRAPWHDRWLAHPDVDDPFWQDTKLEEALSRAGVPVLLYSGWQDLILEQTLEQYEALRRREVDVVLTVGPWNHAELASKASGIITRESLDWLAEHLAGDGKRSHTSPVRIHVTGSGEWRDLPSWPLPTREVELHLQPGGGLGDSAAQDAEPSTFSYDPLDPTPTVGGLTNVRTAGTRDNTKLESRDDVLTFTGPVLDRSLTVLGAPVVELAHSTDGPYADVFVRLCCVDAKGRSWNVSEAYRRLPVDRPPVLRLELSAIAHEFRPGERIRVQVSGGSHPMRDRNLGTGEPPATGVATRAVRHTVAPGLSRVLLPVSVED